MNHYLSTKGMQLSMVLTPKMFVMKERIAFLEAKVTIMKGDYIAKRELEDLKLKFSRLERIERLGLKALPGGKETTSKLSTA